MSDTGESDVKSPSDEEEFSVNAFIDPLGDRDRDRDRDREQKEEHGVENDQETDATGGEEERSQESVQRKSFALTFDSKNIPFEYSLSSEGHIAVSFVSKPIDPRLVRGVVIVGVDGVDLPVGPKAMKAMEKVFEEDYPVPFILTFCSEEHIIENYEEENSYDEYLDEEHHNSGSFEVRSDPDDIDALHPQNSVNYPLSSDSQGTKQNHAVPLSDAATLLKSGVWSVSSSIANKYRSLRGGGGGGGESVPASQQPQNQGDESDHDERDEDDEDMTLSENMFDLILPGRSPPFVFDLHADGTSVVVVKLVGDRRSMDPRLREGCVVRFINGHPVHCKCRQDFDTILAAVDQFPIRMTLEHAPCLYRHQDALSLYTEGASDPAIHMFTVLPFKHVVHNTSEVEGLFETARRAKDVLQAFRAQGIASTLINIETVLIRENHSAYSGDLQLQSQSHSYSSLISAPQTISLLRGVRVWFRFHESFDVFVSASSADIGLLEVVKDGQDSGWIVIRCIGQSVWLDAGMVLGRPYLLTHVNGYDCSSSGYRSIEPRIPGNGTWHDSVLPFFDGSEVKLTLA